jgi:flagella basal body P-ring formation protein FlgA
MSDACELNSSLIAHRSALTRDTEVAMMNGNNRPLSKKKTIQILVALTLLAWATQTLFHQWGFSQEIGTDAAMLAEPLATEKFVPGTPRFAAGATLELRAQATVIGTEVSLKQICRWNKNDEAVFAPLADLVITRFAAKTPFRAISVDEIRGTLHDAGVNLAVIKFAGATSCTIARSDVEYNETVALQQWIDAKEAVADKESVAGDPPATQPSAPVASPASVAQKPSPDVPPQPSDEHYRTLREVLIEDLAARTGTQADRLQVDFLARGERLLNLSEPHFRFTVEPRRSKALGDVNWEVEIASDGSSQTVSLGAYVRIWQEELIVARPLTSKQLIRDEDVIERRMLVENPSDEPLLTRQQAVGQQAARDLKPGMLMTARTVDPVPLVRSGQLITVLLRKGAIEVKSVARATEPGSFGQTIRVKNETTRELYEVVVIGPQTGQLGSDAETSVEPTNLAAVNGN